MHKFFKITTLYIIFALTAISCQSDDSTESTISGNENIVLKRITKNRDNSIINFDSSGRFYLFTINENSINEITLEHFFNNSKQRIKTISQRPSLLITFDFTYNGSGQIEEITKKEESLSSFNETNVIFSYSDNQIIGTSIEGSENFTYTFTFSDSSYSELIKFKAINLTTGTIILEEEYLYYPDGNFKKTNIIESSNDQIDAAYLTYTYDNKENPWVKGNRIDYLNEVLLYADKRTSSLTTLLVSYSKNNRTTSFINDHAITLEYDDSGYLTKEIDYPLNSNNDEAIRFFEYY